MVSETERAMVNRIQTFVKEHQNKLALKNVPFELIDAQIEAWKTMPKEQALKEALALYRNHGLEPAEVGKKLDVLKFIAEIQGAFEPQKDKSTRVVALRVNFITMNNQPPTIQNNSVDIQARVIE